MEPITVLLVLTVGFFLTFLLRYWEYGLTLQYLFLFFFLYNYGLKSTLLILFTLAPIAIYLGCRMGKFYFIHTVNGPMTQISAMLLFVAIAAPTLYFLGTSNIYLAFFIPYVPSQIYDIRVVHRFVGLDYYRLNTNAAIGMLVHYKLLEVSSWWQTLIA